MTEIVSGGCQCGRIRYRVGIENDDAMLCHCRMCQRASGNVSLALKTVKQAAVEWEREPEEYASSAIARRGFCSECGTSLTFRYVEGTDKIDLTVGSFDEPGRFRPTSHFGVESLHAAWLDVAALPRMRSDEYQPLNDRWERPAACQMPEFFESFDGQRIAWREVGTGRPVVLIHGYFSTAEVNWLKFGHAQVIAERGFRVIMPDLRGHGDSAKPHDPAAYPPDALMRDGLALIAHLGLTDYDLGGYSLGARTTVRMLVNGAAPGKVVLSGMGLTGIVSTAGRGGYFRRVLTNLGSFERGSGEWLTEAFLKTTGGDPVALLHILDTFVDTPEAQLAEIVQPALVAAGAEDDDNGSAQALADALPNGRFAEVPGNHMSAVVKPELGQAIADFLAA